MPFEKRYKYSERRGFTEMTGSQMTNRRSHVISHMMLHTFEKYWCRFCLKVASDKKLTYWFLAPHGLYSVSYKEGHVTENKGHVTKRRGHMTYLIELHHHS